MKLPLRYSHGFSRIEIAISVVIVIIICGAVYAALNPVQRLRDAHDARRAADAELILQAIHADAVAHKGMLPAGMAAGMPEKQIGTAKTKCSTTRAGCGVEGSTDCIDLTSSLLAYDSRVPTDPKTGSSERTGYSVRVDSAGIVTVRACGAEGSTPISVSR